MIFVCRPNYAGGLHVAAATWLSTYILLKSCSLNARLNRRKKFTNLQTKTIKLQNSG